MSESHDHQAEIQRLRQSVESLEQRLARIERSLAEMERDSPPRAHERITSWLNETRPDLAPRAASAGEARAAATTAAPLPPPMPPPIPVPPIPMAQHAGVRARDFAASRMPSRSLETMIGQHWASWVGAIVLFLGVVFFLKYAWDRGWIRPSPGARVAAAVGFGVALGALGEWMHRKRLRGLAGALYGAGVAVVVASLFAANVYFDPPVLGRSTAFAGVALTAAVAIAAALHINAMPLAMLALIGAYLCPLVLRTGRDESAFFLAYFGLLAGAGWALSWFKHRWIPLRWLVLICTWVGMLGWWAALGDRYDHENLSLIWTSIFFAGFLGEAVLSLRRRRGAIEAPRDAAYGLPSVSAFFQARPVARLDTNLAVTTLLSTAAALCVFYLTFGRTTPSIVGGLAIGMALVMVAAGLAGRSRAFVVSSILQAAALVTVSVPLILDQFAITIAWLVLGSVLGVLAWQLNLHSVRTWAAILLGLAAVRLFLFDRFDPGLNATVLTIFSQPVTRWLLLGVAIGVLFHLLAWLRPGEGRFDVVQQWIQRRLGPEFSGAAPPAAPATRILNYSAAYPSLATPSTPAWLDPAGAALSVLATGLFILVMHMQWRGPMVTGALVAWLVPITALSARARTIGYDWHAGILALLASARWLAMDNLIPLLDTWKFGSDLPPVLNIPSICGLLLIAAAIAVRRVVPSSEQPPVLRPQEDQLQLGLLVWAAVLVFAWLNFELWRTINWLDETAAAPLADRGIVKQVAMSVLWAIIGFAAVIFGFRKQIAPIRWAALTLLGITLLKILIIDMANVKAIWRILSFVAVGALLLGVSFVYHRQLQSKASSEV